MYWLVKDKSSCPYCTAFDKVERMVTAAENAIADCTYREEINRIDEIRKMPASQRLNAIIHFAVKLVDNESIWPKPKKNKSNQYQQALRDAARHLANSILVELPDRHSGPDEPLSKERMLALSMKAKAICTGECDMDSMDCDEDDAIFCSNCSHLRSFCTDESFCKTCTRDIKEGDSNPCCACTTHWLMENNSMKLRMAVIKAKAEKLKSEKESKAEKATNKTVSRKRVRFEDEENVIPMSNNPVTLMRGIRVEPKGRVLTNDLNDGNEVVAKWVCHPTSDPEEVKQRLIKGNQKRMKLEDQTQQQLKLKRRRLSTVISAKRQGKPLNAKLIIASEVKLAADLDRQITLQRKEPTQAQSEGSQADTGQQGWQEKEKSLFDSSCKTQSRARGDAPIFGKRE